MKRKLNIELEFNFDGDRDFSEPHFTATVEEPESGERETLVSVFPINPTLFNYQSFGKAMTREVYDWIDLWMKENAA